MRYGKKMRYWKNIMLVGVTVLSLTSPSFAYFDEYDDSQSHPLRVAAYILHPVGFALEWLIFRPMHALVSQPELEPITGHTPHGWSFTTPVPRVSETTTSSSVTSSVSTVETDAAFRAAEEAKAAADEAKRAADAAARAAEKTTREFEESLQK
ncbi:MAG: hypothetical protein ACRERD_20270 [Candidatus Binatia bacterium]